MQTIDPLVVPESLKEAQCIINVAYAERKACKAAKRLANYRVQETLLKAQLHQIRADRAEKRLHTAEMNFGRAHAAARRGGYMRLCVADNRTKHRHGTYANFFLANTSTILIH